MPAYIKFDGIDGEVKEKGFEKFVEVLSWSWGASNRPTGGIGGGGAGKASFKEFTIAKRTDLATLGLWETCAVGSSLKQVLMLALERGDGKSFTYYKFRFEDVMVSSISQSAAGPDDAFDFGGLRFRTVRCTYSYLEGDGSVRTEEFGWDLSKNVKI